MNVYLFTSSEDICNFALQAIYNLQVNATIILHVYKYIFQVNNTKVLITINYFI